MRINKFLAECGLGSRRKCEQYVLDGRVKIGGRVVDNLATEVTPKDLVTFDDAPVTPDSKHIYLMLHKPKGYVCTTSDEKGRKTVMDLMPAYKDKRIYPIGRLDYETEGLLLFTNDGELANIILHPKNEMPKTYVARVKGFMEPEDVKKLEKGVEIDGEKTKECKVRLLEFDENESRVEITITEGRNRQVRRMFEAIGKEVLFLKRVSIGEIRLGGLTRGTYRKLTIKEMAYIKSLVSPPVKPAGRFSNKTQGRAPRRK